MIQIEHLKKSYGGKEVLSDVTFTAEDGCITGFVGPNGAGKSTTMRIVACMEGADAGTALVNGKPFREAACPSAEMGIYLGNEYLPMTMTGQDYLAYACRVAGVDVSAVDRLLDSVELGGSGRKTIASYSLGMKQRVGLAAALVANPTTLMLDEPVNGLDPMGVQWLRGVLRAQADKGKAVLLSSHLLSELELVADRVVMLDHGHIVAQGAMGDLEASGDKRVLIHTSDDVALMKVYAQHGVKAKRDGVNISVSDMTARDAGKMAYDAGILVDSLVTANSSLEDVFMNKAAQEEKGASNE